MVKSLEIVIDRPDALDPVENVLALTRARAHVASTLVGHGDWSLAFPARAGAKFNAVTEGTACFASPAWSPSRFVPGTSSC
jgi:hypothetical protein